MMAQKIVAGRADEHLDSIPETSLENLEVLLIDDDEQWARITSVLLERSPEIATVRTAHSFEAGTHELSETVPDCVVCDYQLGDGTGLELLEFVRERYPALPFVLVTGRGDETIASDAIGRGVSDYLPKDHDDGEATLLANRVTQAVAKSVYRHQLAEQRDALKILNEIVRHDIRNALQLVVANADMLDGHTDEEGETYRNRILESTREVIEITNTARDITNTFDQSSTNQTSRNLRQTIEQALESVRAIHDDVVLETDGAIPAVTVRADETLDVVFRNLLTNAITHNDSSMPQITVSATATDTWTHRSESPITVQASLLSKDRESSRRGTQGLRVVVLVLGCISSNKSSSSMGERYRSKRPILEALRSCSSYRLPGPHRRQPDESIPMYPDDPRYSTTERRSQSTSRQRSSLR